MNICGWEFNSPHLHHDSNNLHFYEDVSEVLEKTIKEMCDHIKIWKDVDPNEHLNHLKGRLKVVIDTVSHPLYKETLQKALSMLPDKF